VRPLDPAAEASLGLGDDEGDVVADRQALARAANQSVTRAHAMNEGAGREDLLPDF
jgi:type IV secretion system protein VirD4